MGRHCSAPRREWHFGVNHLGHFALYRAVRGLLPQEDSRVISVTSSAALDAELVLDDLAWERREYGRHAAYSTSKACNVLFVDELARRAAEGLVWLAEAPEAMGLSSAARGGGPSGVEGGPRRRCAVKKLRIRWRRSVTIRFRRCAQYAFTRIFPLVEYGEVEHGGCECMRYNRRLYQADLHDLMHPGVKAVSNETGHVATHMTF
ncbi:unnamed protein product [Prorocentrum cordatum]|uniref:Protochlorophyllide reductase n=1 Tax=Prorocentrum cordatum TaxID=2364126 RepID=A0ABN9RYS5_9DINO|nr:unnamed protein product [Polarella glacialis]